MQAEPDIYYAFFADVLGLTLIRNPAIQIDMSPGAGNVAISQTKAHDRHKFSSMRTTRVKDLEFFDKLLAVIQCHLLESLSVLGTHRYQQSTHRALHVEMNQDVYIRRCRP